MTYTLPRLGAALMVLGAILIAAQTTATGGEPSPVGLTLALLGVLLLFVDALASLARGDLR